jgi:prolyl oligopeptidase
MFARQKTADGWLRAHAAWLRGLAALLVLTACGQVAVVDKGSAMTRETLHGVEVTDPWRWLEDADSERTQGWIRARQGESRAFLDAIPERAQIRKRLEELWNFPRWSAPVERAGRIFFAHNSGLANQPTIYVAAGLEGQPLVLLDPTRLSAEGTVAINEWKPSPDGRYVAWSSARAGSDWMEWRVREVDSGRDLPDLVRWCKFTSVSWLPDSSGFFYARYPEPLAGTELTAVNKNHRLQLHRLGMVQEQDEVILARDDHPDWGFAGEVTDDGQHCVVTSTIGTDTRNRVFLKGTGQSGSGTTTLFGDFDASYDFVGKLGDEFYFRTDKAAPRGRVIAIRADATEESAWRTVVAETDATIADARIVGGRLAVLVMDSVRHRVHIYEADGAYVREVSLPAQGTVSAFSGRPSSNNLFLGFASFTHAPRVLRHDLVSGETVVWREPASQTGSLRYVTEQVTCTSRDGTKVPMYVVRRADIRPDGSAPALLYGYGGFNISIMPGYSPAILTWLEMGGVFAQPALRGGGEFGEAWHRAGMLEQKQNVFDDFIAAAEWLVRSGWTTASKLAIHGGSNGGLLVGACMTQRPELFGAALPAVGVMDMLRYHKFTIGWAWVPEYGSADDAAMFPTLLAYSPLHQLKSGVRYPATLVITADHDDRVVPLHSFKFAARLMELQSADAPPCMIRIETSAGHGAGTPTSKAIEEAADRLAFLRHVLPR